RLPSLSLLPRPPRTTLFPYLTLFRSRRGAGIDRARSTVAGRSASGRAGEVVSAMRSPRPRQPVHVDGAREVVRRPVRVGVDVALEQKSTRLNSSHDQISYAVFCLKKK